MKKTVMDVVSYVHSGPLADVIEQIERVGVTSAASDLCAEASAEGIELVDAEDMEAYLLRLVHRYALISGDGDTGTIEIVTTTAPR